MRVRALALAALLVVVAGCGSGGGRRAAAPASSSVAKPEPPAGTLRALLARPGEDTTLSQGTADFRTGRVRYSFLIIRHDGQPVYRPVARVWVATSLDARPFARTLAHLEPIGVPGESQAAAGDVTRLYVTTFAAPTPGKLFVLAEPEGGKPVQAIGNAQIKAHSWSPEVGSKAIASRTPTIASTHGDLAALTTRRPPDRDLLRYSIADSLAAHRPFVVTFATPKFCTSRTCGPVVDVVDAVRKQFARTRIRFIHVEVYRDNDPAKGFNRWFTQWHLPTEPWTFLVGSNGRIAAKFEGSFSQAELAAAVRRTLLG